MTTLYALNMSADLQTLVTNFRQLLVTKNDFEDMQYSSSQLQLNDTIDTLTAELDRIDTLNITRLDFSTGTAWLKSVYVLNTDVSTDIMGMIDEYATDGNNVLTRYESSEVFSYDEDYQDESFLAINGGEYYTDMIQNAENLTFYELYKKLTDNQQLYNL